MRGQAARAVRILEGLHGEGIDATLVLWAVNKDLQWIARAQHLMRNGHNADSAMNAIYVWRPRQAAMKMALQRLKTQAVQDLLLDAARVDQAIKGVLRTNAWVELEALVARLAGVRMARGRAA
jgi:DNA polymerase-3 subunit delta